MEIEGRADDDANSKRRKMDPATQCVSATRFTDLPPKIIITEILSHVLVAVSISPPPEIDCDCDMCCFGVASLGDPCYRVEAESWEPSLRNKFCAGEDIELHLLSECQRQRREDCQEIDFDEEETDCSVAFLFGKFRRDPLKKPWFLFRSLDVRRCFRRFFTLDPLEWKFGGYPGPFRGFLDFYEAVALFRRNLVFPAHQVVFFGAGPYFFHVFRVLPMPSLRSLDIEVCHESAFPPLPGMPSLKDVSLHIVKKNTKNGLATTVPQRERSKELSFSRSMPTRIWIDGDLFPPKGSWKMKERDELERPIQDLFDARLNLFDFSALEVLGLIYYDDEYSCHNAKKVENVFQLNESLQSLRVLVGWFSQNDGRFKLMKRILETCSKTLQRIRLRSTQEHPDPSRVEVRGHFPVLDSFVASGVTISNVTCPILYELELDCARIGTLRLPVCGLFVCDTVEFVGGIVDDGLFQNPVRAPVSVKCLNHESEYDNGTQQENPILRLTNWTTQGLVKLELVRPFMKTVLTDFPVFPDLLELKLGLVTVQLEPTSLVPFPEVVLVDLAGVCFDGRVPAFPSARRVILTSMKLRIIATLVNVFIFPNLRLLRITRSLPEEETEEEWPIGHPHVQQLTLDYDVNLFKSVFANGSQQFPSLQTVTMTGYCFHERKKELRQRLLEQLHNRSVDLPRTHVRITGLSDASSYRSPEALEWTFKDGLMPKDHKDVAKIMDTSSE